MRNIISAVALIAAATCASCFMGVDSPPGPIECTPQLTSGATLELDSRLDPSGLLKISLHGAFNSSNISVGNFLLLTLDEVTGAHVVSINSEGPFATLKLSLCPPYELCSDGGGGDAGCAPDYSKPNCDASGAEGSFLLRAIMTDDHEDSPDCNVERRFQFRASNRYTIAVK